MRAFATGTILTLTILLGALLHSRQMQAETPDLVGSWIISSRDGG